MTHFSHQSVDVIRKQLNIYDFRKDTNDMTYQHPSFTRNNGDLNDVVRKSSYDTCLNDEDDSVGMHFLSGTGAGDTEEGEDLDSQDFDMLIVDTHSATNKDERLKSPPRVVDDFVIQGFTRGFDRDIIIASAGLLVKWDGPCLPLQSILLHTPPLHAIPSSGDEKLAFLDTSRLATGSYTVSGHTFDVLTREQLEAYIRELKDPILDAVPLKLCFLITKPTLYSDGIDGIDLSLASETQVSRIAQVMTIVDLSLIHI